ncbi:MAG: tetratricopeptide repeat protein [Xanthomonadales bacterium]|nr:tetratricopeptide repeat protein [Gammaproteobacteria bacterium]MBT8055888.1 tetratricopeptide repeat protein [Gammaproteobacteria bacterium]NNL04305.1 tetratricopeptide repeat protein [Xanthomonadales bacterium]
MVAARLPEKAGKEESAINEFFAELRRRRVIRVIVLYAIAGWIVIEVSATVLPGLNLPDWAPTLVIVLVALGFPIAVLMAWAFDLGPGGVTRTGPAEAAPAEAAGSAETAGVVEPAEATEPAKRSDADDRSIAVLPFVNMSGDRENEYFSDGIAEEILNLLVKLPQLKVASRTSSFTFKGKEANIPTVAAELGVATVLEGSVRQAAGRVRITAQLIDAKTDTHLWSETYDREFKDVFAIQDDIAQSIVDALQMTLTPQERRSIQFVATSDAKAYDHYLRGRSFMYSMSRRDYEHAITMYQQAIEVDDKYALAYAGMADAYAHLYRYADASAENAAKAEKASKKAIELDPDSSEAHASRGLSLFISEQYEAAHEEFREAIRLNPKLWEAHYYSGLASASKGDFEAAIEHYRNAIEVNSADYQAPLFMAQAYASLGRKHDEMKVRLDALSTLQQHLEMNPHDTRALYICAQNLCCVGEFEKGSELADRALAQGNDEPVVLYNVACFYAHAGDKDRSIDMLERAVDKGWGDKAWIETDSDLDSLREMPRFQELLARID